MGPCVAALHAGRRFARRRIAGGRRGPDRAGAAGRREAARRQSEAVAVLHRLDPDRLPGDGFVAGAEPLRHRQRRQAARPQPADGQPGAPGDFQNDRPHRLDFAAAGRLGGTGRADGAAGPGRLRPGVAAAAARSRGGEAAAGRCGLAARLRHHLAFVERPAAAGRRGGAGAGADAEARRPDGERGGGPAVQRLCAGGVPAGIQPVPVQLRDRQLERRGILHHRADHLRSGPRHGHLQPRAVLQPAIRCAVEAGARRVR